MSLITWNESLSVGVKSIDAQHSILVETLNELHDAMMKGQAKNLTGPILKNLVAYTRDHFSSEESMMAAAHYPDLPKHREQHRMLTEKVEGYVARFERGEITLNLHLLNFLRDWLTNHIQREDRAYGPCMVQHGLH
jgi:hemerythrin